MTNITVLSTPSKHIATYERINPSFVRHLDEMQPLGVPAGEYVKAKEVIHLGVPEGTPWSTTIEHEFCTPSRPQAMTTYNRLIASGYRPQDKMLLMQEDDLIAMASWKATKLIYRFDARFAAELIDTPITAAIPTRILNRLPAPAFFLEVSEDIPDGLFDLLDTEGISEGFFIAKSGDRLIVSSMVVPTFHIPLDQDLDIKQTINESIRKRLETINPNSDLFHSGSDFASEWQQSQKLLWAYIVNALLYLCVDEPDIEGRSPPKAHKVQYGNRWRTKEAKRETVGEVGYRLGAVFRREQDDRDEREERPHGAKSMPAHIRRAHWHTYWVGPRSNPEPTLRWLSPIIVNALTSSELIDTVHPVMREKVKN